MTPPSGAGEMKLSCFSAVMPVSGWNQWVKWVAPWAIAQSFIASATASATSLSSRSLLVDGFLERAVYLQRQGCLHDAVVKDQTAEILRNRTHFHILLTFLSSSVRAGRPAGGGSNAKVKKRDSTPPGGRRHCLAFCFYGYFVPHSTVCGKHGYRGGSPPLRRAFRSDGRIIHDSGGFVNSFFRRISKKFCPEIRHPPPRRTMHKYGAFLKKYAVSHA